VSRIGRNRRRAHLGTANKQEAESVLQQYASGCGERPDAGGIGIRPF
jgi:hypothetical protein